MELQKLAKQNAIKKISGIKSAIMTKCVKAPDRSQARKMDYAVWCMQEEVNVKEMSEKSQLCEESLQWKWKRENSHNNNMHCIQFVSRWENKEIMNEYKPRTGVLR